MNNNYLKDVVIILNWTSDTQYKIKFLHTNIHWKEKITKKILYNKIKNQIHWKITMEVEMGDAK